jgi:putative ATP-binding cassette transporter
MSLFTYLLRISRREVILAAIVGALAGVGNTGLIALINHSVSAETNAASGLVAAFAGMGLLMLLTSLVSRLLLIRLAQRVTFDMRMHLSRRILAASLRHLEQVSAPRLLAALTDDVMAVTNALLSLPTICINASVLIMCLIYLGWLSWPVLLAVFVFMILGVFSYQAMAGRALRYLRRAREEQTALFRHYRALTEGTKELKIHRRRREEFLDQALQSTAASFRLSNVSGMTLYAAADSWGQFLFFVLIGLLIFALPGWRQVSTLTLMGYTLTMLYMMTPMQVLLNLLPVLGRAQVSLREVERLGLSLDAAASQSAGLAPRRPVVSPSRLELRSVTHAYRVEREDNNFILGPLDLSFEPGEMVFVVGGNGSGKTTLVKLITGLYAPESGQVLLNGEPVTDETSDDYRQHFSAVFSDFYLFESLLGLQQSELDAQARAHLVQLQLDRQVNVSNGTLSTTALSQGQRKRLALLTAYLENRPFYIFDEWASDQDPLFKEVFYTQLLPELKSRGKTLIIITHDDKYFHLADRLIRLDYGRVSADTRSAVELVEALAI